MRQVVLYIAMSLDGYIADTEGGVGWLDRLEGARRAMPPFSRRPIRW